MKAFNNLSMGKIAFIKRNKNKWKEKNKNMK